jgi:hypothetical protein
LGQAGGGKSASVLAGVRRIRGLVVVSAGHFRSPLGATGILTLLAGGHESSLRQLKRTASSEDELNFQGNAIDQLSKVKWNGDTLKVDTTMSFGGNPVNVTMAMSLDASGNLVVVSTRPDFQGGGAPVTTKATYKKVE